MASDEITVSGIIFNHGTNCEYEFYFHTDRKGVLWQVWRHLHEQEHTGRNFMNIEDLHMERLVVPSPPMLPEAIGYSGRARYLAFYWTPCGDEIIYSDGRLSADGHWHAWLLFTRHRTIVPHLQAYNLGSSDEEATHWLLVDRETCVLYVGTPGEVLRVLRGQYADQAPDSEPQRDGISDEITLDDFRNLIDSFIEVSGPSPEEIVEAMRKQDTLTEELRAWLDSNPSSESS